MKTPASPTLLLKIAIVLVLVAAAGLLLLLGHDLKSVAIQLLDTLRDAGPLVFFTAMAILPAIGAPLSFFSLTAGSLFSPQFGMPLVTTYALTAIIVNMALSYVLADRGMRPLLLKLVQRLGYRLPQASSVDFTSLIVLLRVTPGVPFPVQNYLLAFAGVPFGRYIAVSAAIALPMNAAFLFFGEAVLQGRSGRALVGLLVVVAVFALLQLLRRHYRRAADPERLPRPPG